MDEEVNQDKNGPTTNTETVKCCQEAGVDIPSVTVARRARNL